MRRVVRWFLPTSIPQVIFAPRVSFALAVSILVSTSGAYGYGTSTSVYDVGHVQVNAEWCVGHVNHPDRHEDGTAPGLVDSLT